MAMDWRGNPVDKQRHGGLRSSYFIYFMVVMSSMAYRSTLLSLVNYLQGVMHMGISSSSTMVTNVMGVTSAFALLGAFLSDSYITRFRTILIFGPFEFIGFGLLALQAHIPSLGAPPCNTSRHYGSCKHVHGFNATLFSMALYSISLGEGFLRACLASFGGDQFDSNDPIESQQKSSFFNWFTFCISLGTCTGLVFIVWLEDYKGWDYAFGVCALAILLGLLAMVNGFSFYRHQKPGGSALTRVFQVFVAAFRKRRLIVPDNFDRLQQLEANEGTVDTEELPHTKGLRFLDKAAIKHGNTRGWSFCSVTQVEETKIVLRMLPMFISTTFAYMPNLVLAIFSIEQGSTMDTRIGNIHVSATTLLALPVFLQMVLLVAYDRLFVPFARRITGIASGITPLQRVGAGFVSTILATCAAAALERKRRMIAAENGLQDSGAVVPMSVLWLLPQFCTAAIMDVTSFPGLLELFNREASRGTKSMGTAVCWCVLGFSSLMGTLLVEVVNKVTRQGEKGKGWLDGKNLNRSRLDLFYWLISALGLLGFLNYLYWARRYVYRHNLRVANS